MHCNNIILYILSSIIGFFLHNIQYDDDQWILYYLTIILHYKKWIFRFSPWGWFLLSMAHLATHNYVLQWLGHVHWWSLHSYKRMGVALPFCVGGLQPPCFLRQCAALLSSCRSQEQCLYLMTAQHTDQREEGARLEDAGTSKYHFSWGWSH